MTSAQIKNAGVDGFIVSFADTPSETANRAALSFRAAVDAAKWPGIDETSTSLVSTYIRFDHLRPDRSEIESFIRSLIMKQDWLSAPLPEGRRRWQVPITFGGNSGPQISDAAQAVSVSESDVVAAICSASLRVQTIGFAPAMPYMGFLPDRWNIPRQTSITPQVPAGGVCLAIRQLVLFPVTTPTGWWHIGQTALRLFRPGTENPFILAPGDEVQFNAVSRDAIVSFSKDDDGGATWETID